MIVFRRLLLAAALMLSATFLVPASPANAGGQAIRVCFQVGEFGGRPIFDCFTIVLPELAPKPPWPPECLSCPVAFDPWDELDIWQRHDYVRGWGEGLGLLGQAALSTDPKEIKHLRALAQESFFKAADISAASGVELENVGWADLKKGEFFPDSTGNAALKSAGENLIAGHALMQKALGDPHPEPNIEAAMARFDQAYLDIAEVYGG